MSLSLIIPVYNEKELLGKNVTIFYDYLKGLKIPFEILICDNGSTEYKGINFTKKEVRYLRAEKRGLGIGIKLGIDNAQYNNLMFYAIDIPFGLDIIKESLDKIEEYDIVIGSKAHPESVNNHSSQRKMFSKMYNRLVNSMFHLGVGDTQGSLMFKKINIIKYKDYLDAEDAFLETQILIYGKLFNNRIIEIPVKYETARKDSKISPFSDGMKILKSCLREKERIKKIET